jgi:NAD(P)-dependent dehydrogenase (short-subunit alcohol dehydrogenase family)
MTFEGRTALITGGAIGFGRAFARALAAGGANVVLADIDVDGAERTAAELVSAGAHAIAVDCDVADVDRVDAAVATTPVYT